MIINQNDVYLNSIIEVIAQQGNGNIYLMNDYNCVSFFFFAGLTPLLHREFWYRSR